MVWKPREFSRGFFLSRNQKLETRNQPWLSILAFMKIGIYGKHFGPEFDAPVSQLIQLMLKRNFELFVHEDFYSFLRERVAIDDSLPTFSLASDCELDVVISVGGDGTLLNTLTIVRDTNTPVLGVNTGRLGFLSNVSIDLISDSVNVLANQEFEIDQRELIEVVCDYAPLGDFDYAMNEVTVHKKDTSSMITVDVHVDGAFMNTYWADGLIICTPTGSTAYSLSCGGPIAMPGSKNWVFTPIAPHNLNVRPFVVPNDHEITIKTSGREPHHLLTLDSRSYTIESDDAITLRRAPFTIGLINLPGQHFFKTIRNKLNWGIDQRN